MYPGATNLISSTHWRWKAFLAEVDSNSQIFDLNPLLPGHCLMYKIHEKRPYQRFENTLLVSPSATLCPSCSPLMPSVREWRCLHHYLSLHLFFKASFLPVILISMHARATYCRNDCRVIGAHMNKKHMPMAFGHHPFSIHYFSSMLRARSHLKCVRRPST